ncbi:LytR/AlgR family response regulator transcription factor [Eubacterium limosum]|uniref:LytR/AlgR family response regulator transcription factor n=1 Tax=Eubacterium limosum TaxID=1736 RepID=UPI0010634ACC|nr:LytTR family DNA-binding domain-containing protein [Eubacterium limosum]
MINISICDDENNVLDNIETLLLNSKFAGDFRYDLFNSIERMVNHQEIENISYDIFFLDIELNGQNGLEFAKKLRRLNRTSLIIFITNYSNFVFEVFEVFAFDFIQKPINPQRFNLVFDRAMTFLLQNETNFIFSNKNKTISVPFKKILYIEKSGRKAIIHTLSINYECYLTIKEIWKQLSSNLFVSIYSSVIVNLTHIEEISDSIILDNSEILYIGRSYKNK